MQKFPSRFGRIVLTDERKGHILRFHPEIAAVFRHFASTLSEPNLIVHSANDVAVRICYRKVPRRAVYLAVVVKTGNTPFILTAYLAKKPKSGTL